MKVYIFFIILFYFIFAYVIYKSKDTITAYLKNRKHTLVYILIAALLLRIVLACIYPGHANDYGSFKAWSHKAVDTGILHFYSDKGFADYPPLFVVIFFIQGLLLKLCSLLHLSFLDIVIMKLPAMAADIGIGFIIYTIASKKTDIFRSLFLSALFLFNPAVILNSTIWAQVDSVLTLVVLISLYLLHTKRVERAFIIYTLSLFLKPQALFFAPVFGFYFVINKDLRESLNAVLCSLITFLTVALPFAFVNGPLWIFKFYYSAITGYSYATINAPNIYALIKGNWAPISESFLQIPYRVYGTLFFIVIIIFLVILLIKDRKNFYRHIFLYALTAIYCIYFLTVNMHERYLYYAIAVGFCAFILVNDTRIFSFTIIMSLVHYLVTATCYHLSLDNVFTLQVYTPFFIISALVHLILLVYLIYLVFDIIFKISIVKIIPFDKLSLILKSDGGDTDPVEQKRIVFNKIDVFVVVTLVIISGCLYFYKLGSIKAPVTGWRPTGTDRSLIIDLGARKRINSISYYTGINAGAIEVLYHKNNRWVPCYTIKKDVYTWKKADISISTRFIKLDAQNDGCELYEIGFFKDRNLLNLKVLKHDAKKNDVELLEMGLIEKLEPLAIQSTNHESGMRLFDEQDLIPDIPLYYNSTYFDEYTYVRTAVEHLHHKEFFEWTHPPLGKLLIAGGIAMFGTTPFGMRLPGVLFGILLIVTVYFFALFIFRSRFYAVCASLLLCFDFMTFVQSRLAVLGIFTVTFIVLTIFFMMRFYFNSIRDAYRTVDYRSLVLSGLFFGFSIATKWTGFYAGIALFIIFATYVYKRYVMNNKLGKDFNTLMFVAFGAFIVIPVVLYILSYLPVMKNFDNGLRPIWYYQKMMLSYHSHLKESHPYASQWWSWPLMLKPVWYYTAQHYFPAGMTSTISAMGNPAVWWLSLPVLVLTVFIAWRKRDTTGFFLAISFLALYLPWMFVSRVTFLYHYFPVIPFVILMIVYVFKSRGESVIVKIVLVVYIAGCIALFVVFYPVISGMIVSKGYVAMLQWFKGWIF